MLDSEVAEIVENLRLLGGDGADVEAKRAERQLPSSIRATLSAFANTSGGVVILGLDEAGGFAARGVRDAAKMANDLASWCSTEMEPPPRPLIRVHQFEGVSLVVAEIPELDASSKPCFYRGAGITQGSYVRVSDGDRHLSSYEVQMMLVKRGRPRDDEDPVTGTGAADLAPRLVAEFLARLRQTRPYAFADLDTDAALRRAKVIVGPAGSLSLGGLLALASFPQEHFPQLMMTFVHYPTAEGADLGSGERFVDNVVLEGPIPIMVRDGMAALRRNMSRRAVVRGAGREDTWEYPEAALREVIVNALVHRDLSPASRGTQTQIEMYPDRLVVRNPGGLFGPVKIDQLGEEGISSARNGSMMQVLEDVPIPGGTRTVCENRGSGIRTMISALRRARMSPPAFQDRIGSFTVTFPNHTLLGEDAISWINSLGEDGLNDNQCFALAMLRDGGTMDDQTYRQVAGVDSQVARTELRDLVSRHLVTQVGSHRWTRYQLASAPGRRSGRTARQRADRRQQLLDELADGPLSRAELERRTGLGTAAVRRWLGIMREEGLIESTETAVRSPNVLYRRAAPYGDE
ncbi:MAG: putative DNA binding domain-containing protein [Pseudonocardia sp.]|nr:putative DNA binding domain-containing protein [Pseudonocardia sp.]